MRLVCHCRTCWHNRLPALASEARHSCLVCACNPSQDAARCTARFWNCLQGTVQGAVPKCPATSVPQRAEGSSGCGPARCGEDCWVREGSPCQAPRARARPRRSQAGAPCMPNRPRPVGPGQRTNKDYIMCQGSWAQPCKHPSRRQPPSPRPCGSAQGRAAAAETAVRVALRGQWPLPPPPKMICSCSVVAITADSDSANPSSNLGRSSYRFWPGLGLDRPLRPATQR